MKRFEAPEDINAFVANKNQVIEGKEGGPLSGLNFAVKDIFDIEGQVTGAGNPVYTEAKQIAQETCLIAQTLLEAGANLVGRTISDEFAFSLDGENSHYGTPLNTMCPDRVPGGSSSGSASAVAANLVDFALGADTAGSVRVPASFCGLYGNRTTFGALNMEGIHPMAHSYDVTGWFTRDLDVFERVSKVLLPDYRVEVPSKLYLARDMLALTAPAARDIYEHYFEALKQKFEIEEIEIIKPDIKTWTEVFRCIQWYELNEAHGHWMHENLNSIGEEIRGRVEKIQTITSEELKWAKQEKEKLIEYARSIIKPGTILLLPTTPDIAPMKGNPIPLARELRSKIINITAFSSVSGLPQLSMPLLKLDGCPLGVSIIGAPESDLSLIEFAQQICDNTNRA